MLRKLILAITIVSCVVSMTACAEVWPFSSGPQDIRVTSVNDVDFKNQAQIQWTNLKPRPSTIITRIEFITNTDLLALAKKKDYNVSFIFGPCAKDGVQDSGLGMGYVYSGNQILLPGTKETPEYAEVVAKGPPYTYQAFARKAQLSTPQVPMCFTLSGGSMIGSRLRSNVAALPTATN